MAAPKSISTTITAADTIHLLSVFRRIADHGEAVACFPGHLKSYNIGLMCNSHKLTVGIRQTSSPYRISEM